ncbi:MAG TPA: benzoate-CoA ligase family protein [Pyrinomonadaceae bacterium]|nr:benzoate-CoA ligase family protein [Pyrinomonadaceae bacterium]
MNLFDAIFQHRRQSPAIIYDGRELSYADLADHTRTMASAIASVGTQRQDRVALLLNDSPEFIEAFIAICSMGAIAVPINTALRLEEQRAIIHNCRARVAIVEDDICDTLLSNAPEELHFPEEILTVGCTPQPVQDDNSGDHFYVTDERMRRPRTRINPLEYLREQKKSVEPDFSADDEDAVAFILYTSGSTGEPKGAMHSQADIFYTNATFCRQVLQLRPDDRLFSSSRLPFAYGLGNSFSFPLLNGATSVLCRERPTADVVSRILKNYRPTIFFAVPVVYNLLLEYHEEKQPLDCSSLRMCVSAGEALPAHLGERWEKTFGVPVLDGIGSTEMLHMFMSNKMDDVCYGSSGRVLSGYEARLLDEHGEPSAKGAEGNLWIKGSSAAAGYWERPEESARTFVDGWVRTGDLYRCDDSGHWFHMGRSDDCFKSSGQWVSPVDVEGVLLRHQKVARAAVVEDFDEDSLPCACAFVVSHSAHSEAGSLETELRALAAGALPKFKQPRKYVFVTELPYTATGKVQRFKLRQALREKQRRAKT